MTWDNRIMTDVQKQVDRSHKGRLNFPTQSHGTTMCLCHLGTSLEILLRQKFGCCFRKHSRTVLMNNTNAADKSGLVTRQFPKYGSFIFFLRSLPSLIVGLLGRPVLWWTCLSIWPFSSSLNHFLTWCHHHTLLSIGGEFRWGNYSSPTKTKQQYEHLQCRCQCNWIKSDSWSICCIYSH